MTTTDHDRFRPGRPAAGPFSCYACEQQATEGREFVEGEPLCAACADFLDELRAGEAAFMLPRYVFAGLAIALALLFVVRAWAG